MAERLDASKSNYISIFGRKGSGKSVLAQHFWDSYPYDRLVIDPTGDVDPHDPKTRNLTTPLPLSWPGELNEERTTLRFQADPGSATYLDDMDQALGLAYLHGRCMVWLDEVGQLTNANRTPPYASRLLQMGRHRHLSPLFCGPRPIDINPLVISQADYIACFELPNPADRKRVADNIGFDLGDFEDAHRLLVDHGYLWWNTAARELTVCQPLPHHGAPPKPDRFAQETTP